MFYSRKLNESIDHIHERVLRIVYTDFNSSFQEFHMVDNSLNILHRNLQNLGTQIFKVKSGLSLELMNDVIEFIKKPYSPRASLHFRSVKIQTTKCSKETPSYLGPKLLNLVPNEHKTTESLADIKVKIKTWVPENCPCRLCKT